MKAKRILKWAAAGCLLLLIVATVGGGLYLNSSSFQRFAMRKIVAEVDTATGGKAELGRFDFDLKRLTATFYNITLRGTEGSDVPPLLHADKLSARIKIVSALHRQFSLDELLIEHPVLHIRLDRDRKSNVPTAPPSQSSSDTSVFALAVRHVQLSKGEVYYKDRKIPLEADLSGLATNIRFESAARSYVGSVCYSNGHLRYAQYASLPHRLSLNFIASPQNVKLSPLTLVIGSSEVDLSALVSNYWNPIAEGDYQIRLHTQDFASMSPSVSPSGEVFLAGRVHYQFAASQALVRSVSVEGKIASDILRAVASGKHLELRKLKGEYRIADGNLQISSLSGETFGGAITTVAEMKHLDSDLESTVRATLSNVSLKAIQRALGRQVLPGASLSGTLGGDVAASWKGSITNLRAHSDLVVRASASSRSNPSAQELPVNGSFHVAYDGRRQTIELHDTTFRLPSAILTAQGSISNQSNLQVQLVANDLHQLTAVASSFRAASGEPWDISGFATVNATVHGSMKEPIFSGQVGAHNLHLEGSDWSSAKLSFLANPSRIAIENASLVNAHHGAANLNCRVALRQWSYDAPNAIEANLRVKQLPLAELEALAKQNYPISGDLSANIDLRGSQLQPVGSGSATIENGHAYGEFIQSLSARFRAENGSIVSTLNLSAAAGNIDANLSLNPKTKGYKLQLNAPSVALSKIETLQKKNLGINGIISASTSSEGSLDNPQLTATVQSPQLQVKQTSISGFKAEVRVSEHRADLNLDARVSAAWVHAHGDVALNGDYDAEAVIDTGTVPLDALIAAYASTVPQGFQGRTELHATLKGPLKDRSRLEAHVSIPVLQGAYQNLEIGIAQPIRADYENSVVTLQPAELRGTGTSLRVQGRIPVSSSAPPELTVQGSVDLRILQILTPNTKTSGAVALDLHSSGSATTPEFRGQVQLKDVAMTIVDAPIAVEKLNGTLDVNNNRVQISTMTAQMGGGQVSVAGSISYKPALQFNLAVQGKSVRFLYPEGVRSLVDANLTFTGTAQASALSGRVLLDSLSMTPDFDLSTVSDQFSVGTMPAQPGFADTIQLAIVLQSRNSLNASSSQISIAGQAALQVGGTADNPVITGRTTLNSGELFFNNVRYQLQRGVITFDDPNETHPVMNVSVTTTVEQYHLTLTMRGPLDKLTTSYGSDPPLATADIINLIARGKTTEEQAASSQSTDSMIASQVAGQLSSGVQKLAGISSLQIDPTLAGNNSNSSARVAIQQRVSKDLLFSFSTDVSQPGSEIVQGEYQINRRWSVSVTRDQLGGVSVDGRFHKKF